MVTCQTAHEYTKPEDLRSFLSLSKTSADDSKISEPFCTLNLRLHMKYRCLHQEYVSTSKVFLAITGGYYNSRFE